MKLVAATEYQRIVRTGSKISSTDTYNQFYTIGPLLSTGYKNHFALNTMIRNWVQSGGDHWEYFWCHMDSGVFLVNFEKAENFLETFCIKKMCAWRLSVGKYVIDI